MKLKPKDETPITSTVAAPSAFDDKTASFDSQFKEALAELTRKHPRHPEGTINTSHTGRRPLAVPRPDARHEPYPTILGDYPMPHVTLLPGPGPYGIPGPYGVLLPPPAPVPFAGPGPYATSNARPLLHLFFTLDRDYMVEMGFKMPAEEFMDVYQEMIRLCKGRKPSFISAKTPVPFDASTDLDAVNPPIAIPTSSLNEPKTVSPTAPNEDPTPDIDSVQPLVSTDAKTPNERKSVDLTDPSADFTTYSISTQPTVSGTTF